MTRTLGTLALAFAMGAAPAFASDAQTTDGTADKQSTTEKRQSTTTGTDGASERKEGDARQ